MLTLLHLSDVHFGPPYHPEIGESLLRFAAETELDAIVVSGDFTQRARVEQYREARAFLQRLPEKPLIVTPGNHDIPLYRIGERARDPYGNYRRYISSELNSVTRLPGAVIVALNSTAPYRAITNGRIDRWQLDFARQAFDDAPEEVQRVIVAHHHFAPPPDFEGAAAMPGARRALDAFTAMRVDLILGGHLHRAYVGNSLDVYSGRDREHGIIIAQAGTATSRRGRAREREKNSFNLLRLDSKLIRLTHYMYFDQAEGFVPTSRHIFFRGGKPSFGAKEAEAGAFYFDHE